MTNAAVDARIVSPRLRNGRLHQIPTALLTPGCLRGAGQARRH